MKTTKRDFDYFKQRCRYWIRRFGLTDWRMDYFHEECPDAKAECSWRTVDRTATITLATMWHRTPVTKAQLNRTALHEVMEILLAPLAVASHGADEAAEAKHAIIYRMAHAMGVRK